MRHTASNTAHDHAHQIKHVPGYACRGQKAGGPPKNAAIWQKSELRT